MSGIEGEAEQVVAHLPAPGLHPIPPVEQQVRSMQVVKDSTARTPGRRLKIVREGDGDPRHGSTSTYVNHFCRCEHCRAAWATYNRELRRRRREAQGDA